MSPHNLSSPLWSGWHLSEGSGQLFTGDFCSKMRHCFWFTERKKRFAETAFWSIHETQAPTVTSGVTNTGGWASSRRVSPARCSWARASVSRWSQQSWILSHWQRGLWAGTGDTASENKFPGFLYSSSTTTSAALLIPGSSPEWIQASCLWKVNYSTELDSGKPRKNPCSDTCNVY